MLSLRSLLTSSQEKCFTDQFPEDFPVLRQATMLRNQHYSFQLIYRADSDAVLHTAALTLSGALAPYAEIYDVVSVPVPMPAYAGRTDDNYLRTAPGLYPDLLQPLHYGNRLSLCRNQLRSVWICLSPEAAMPAGDYPLTLTLTGDDGTVLAEHTLPVHVIDALLPEHGLLLTQWFHADCLASFYHVPVFSERHWEIIGNYLRTAARYGQTMILTPLFTPPLDTEIGRERPTVQLVTVFRNNGEYAFDFSLLGRWIDLCEECGIHWFEMSHLFTQWGAAHAPKIVAFEGEAEKPTRIFGWDTDAAGDEYRRFLHALLPALLRFLRERGVDQRCKFHLSDEPNEACLDHYRAAKQMVAEALSGYDLMDALSSFRFYSQGLVSLPIPASNAIEPFLDAHVKGLWTYYCCAQDRKVSNRFIAMPSWRNRAIGMQWFTYDIVGFLHWGYNFYYNMGSHDLINPYLDNSGELQVPAGDPFVVYPAPDGTALPSLRLMVFREAQEDLAAMKLCASIHGKAAVVAAMETAAGEKIRFDRCPHTAAEMLRVRAAVDYLIEQRSPTSC